MLIMPKALGYDIELYQALNDSLCCWSVGLLQRGNTLFAPDFKLNVIVKKKLVQSAKENWVLPMN